MNTKKIIGTIIGVIMFVALIAGATFAWLTFGVTVGEEVLTANTLNFIVKYDTGSAVTDLPILDSNLINADDAAVVSIVLRKNENSPEGHASIWLNTTSTTKLTEDGVVRWVICRDTNVEPSGQQQVDDVCGGQVIMSSDEPQYFADGHGSYNSGTITGSGPIPLLSDARLADGAASGEAVVSSCSTNNGLSMCTGSGNNNSLLSADGVSYFVYMWLEAEPLVNEHLDEQYYKVGTTEQYKVGGGGTPDVESGIQFNLYDGFVFASATQLQD